MPANKIASKIILILEIFTDNLFGDKYMSFIMNCCGSYENFMKLNVESAIYHLCDGIRVDHLRDAIRKTVDQIGNETDLYEVLDLASPLAKRTQSAYVRCALIQAIHNIPHKQRAAVVQKATADHS